MDSESSDHQRCHAEPALLHGRLRQQPGSLKSLLDRVRQFEMLERSIRDFMHQTAANSFRIANLRGDVLVIFCNSAAASTDLRYQSQALIDHLRERHGLALRKLLIRVRPRYGS